MAVDNTKKWYLIDASGQVLGRLATKVATLLMGKHKPTFARNIDVGDYVVVINAKNVRLTGKKLEQKLDYRHSGYPGGQKFTQYKVMMKDKPEEVIKIAVHGMLPKNKLGHKLIDKLKVYKGETHSHIAQNPEVFKME
ncbi:MAG: 50S ribosomal protein L13 [Candidatus Firestonebacteria bacterium]